MKKRLPFKFITFATLLLLAIFAVENINHRFWLNDFKVYYGAAQAFTSGTPVYGTLFALGSGYYKYSPFTILLVLPLSVFPYYPASILQYFLIAISIISVFIVSWCIVTSYLFGDKIKRKDFFLSLILICVINHLVRELHLGNINVILLLLLCLTLLFVLEDKPVFAGMLLAVVIMTKPFFILVLLPLLLRRNFKLIFSFGISSLIFLLIPSVFVGFEKNLELHLAWFHTLLEHNSAFPSNNTIGSLVKLYISPGLPDAFQFYVMIAVLIGYVLFYFLNKAEEEKDADNRKLKTRNLVIEWFTLVAIMPSIFKTDTQHFLLSLPLLMIILCYLSVLRNYFLVVCFVLLVFMYGGNSSDMVGKVLAQRLDEAGVLGISNLIVLTWVILIHFTVFRKESTMI